MLEHLKDSMPQSIGAKAEKSLSISQGEILQPNLIDNQQVTEQEIIDTFNITGSISKTANLLSISYRQVNKLLVKRKIKGIRRHRKQVKFNVDYFADIDTETKAYFIGLFHADGSYFETTQGKKTFAIVLNEKDRELIEKLLICLDLPTNFMEIIPDKRQVGFRNSTASFTKHLADIKSPSLIDRVPTELRAHFIRGVFDGDGTIYAKKSKGKYKYYYAGFIGVLSFMEFIQKMVPVKFSIRATNSKGIYRIETFSKNDMLALYDFLYTDANIFLHRKHQKFLDMKFLYSTSTTTWETSSN